MRSVTFVVEGPPATKERPRFTRTGGTYTPSKTRAAERTLALVAASALPPGWPLDARYSMTARVYFGDARRRDIDNAIKLGADALNGVAYADDSQVVELHAFKHIDRARPRVEWTIAVCE